MRVLVPTHLHRYTDGVSEVELKGSTLGDVLDRLDECYPGIRFRIVDEQDRIRTHIRLAVGTTVARELSHPVEPEDTVQIIAALSGG